MNLYQLTKHLASLSGYIKYRWKNLPPNVYIYNYHRIGNSNLTSFDPNVYSCDEPHFEEQVKLLASRFSLISIDQLKNIIEAGEPLKQPVAMITFDDGYADNFTIAVPILKSIGVVASFFVSTKFIGSKSLPWWDEAAWLIRNTKSKSIQLPGWSTGIPINQQNIATTIRDILKQLKKISETSMETKMSQLRSACDCEISEGQAESLFMSWEQVNQLVAAGMDVGSHGVTHSIFSHLSKSEQIEELASSKLAIENAVKRKISAFAYPVGGADSYTEESMLAVAECGYEVGFSFINGVNSCPISNRYDLYRIPVGQQSAPAEIQFLTLSALRAHSRR